MIPFSSIFSIDFFFNLGYALLAVVGLVLAIQYRRSQDGKVSLFLLLTTVLVTTYYTLQWLLGSFISYYVSNYAAAHPDFQFPTWLNLSLVILFTALNYAFIIMLGLTAWFAVRRSRSESLLLAEGDEDASVEGTVSESGLSAEQTQANDSEMVVSDPPVAGPEA